MKVRTPSLEKAAPQVRAWNSLGKKRTQSEPKWPRGWSHFTCRSGKPKGGGGEKKKKTHPPWLQGTEVSPSASQAWPVEHCTLWCINICLWRKFKQPCVAARHNRKPTSKGKCLLQWWPKEQLPANVCIWLARPACSAITQHLATSHWPLGYSHPLSYGDYIL